MILKLHYWVDGKSGFHRELNLKYPVHALKEHVRLLDRYGKYLFNKLILYFQIMKAVEVLSVFAAIFLVNLSLGNGAPQWRPQGRFGKRFNTRTNDLITALTSGKKFLGIIRPITE